MGGGLRMAVENDPAWPRWSKAFDRAVEAGEAVRALSHLPDNHPDKARAWGAMKIAQAELNTAANEIEPKFTP